VAPAATPVAMVPAPAPVVLTPEPLHLAAVIEDVRRSLDDQLDELRGQLDDAFNEMAHRINRTELRLAAFRAATETQTELTHAVGKTSEDTLALLRELIASVDVAVEAGPSDTTASDRADDALAARLVEDRMHLEAAVDELRREVLAWRDAPTSLDTHQLEETIRRGLLHNAADIANVARDVENLEKVVRYQSNRLGEVHSTLEWVKQRLLNR